MEYVTGKIEMLEVKQHSWEGGKQAVYLKIEDHSAHHGCTWSGYYKATDATDFRSKNIESIESLEKNSIDFYASVKSLYLQNRLQKISNEEISNKSQDDSDWEEIDSQ